jgi:hypothetical protein
MAKKNQQVEDVVGGEGNDQVEVAPSRNRKSMVIELSDATLASIEEAAVNFSTFGLKLPAAREMVAREIERLAAEVSAVALFATEVQAKLAALAAPKQ